MSEKLKPCPFCGSEAEQMRYWVNRWMYKVRCEVCGASSKESTYENDVIHSWNTRVYYDQETLRGSGEQ